MLTFRKRGKDILLMMKINIKFRTSEEQTGLKTAFDKCLITKEEFIALLKKHIRSDVRLERIERKPIDERFAGFFGNEMEYELTLFTD